MSSGLGCCCSGPWRRTDCPPLHPPPTGPGSWLLGRLQIRCPHIHSLISHSGQRKTHPAWPLGQTWLPSTWLRTWLRCCSKTTLRRGLGFLNRCYDTDFLQVSLGWPWQPGHQVFLVPGLPSEIPPGLGFLWEEWSQKQSLWPDSSIHWAAPATQHIPAPSLPVPSSVPISTHSDTYVFDTFDMLPRSCEDCTQQCF